MSKESGSPYINGSTQDKAWTEGYHRGRIEFHQSGVKAGRDLERDIIGEKLVLLAQEYGHAQFVFTRENLEELQVGVDALSSSLASIETLR